MLIRRDTFYVEPMPDAWDQDGFVVLAGAAPPEALEAYRPELQAAGDRLLVRAPGDDGPALAARTEGTAGAVDPYAVSGAARELLLAPATVAAITELLRSAPLLLDAVETAAGAPDPGPYRDSTYVALADPDTLVGAVVALGETSVACFPGSHRLEVEPFSGRYRHFNSERDGDPALDDHRRRLTGALAEAHVERRVVTLAPGDVLLWRADLVHEAPEGDALVAHLAAESTQPGWFTYRPQRAARAAHGDAWMTSQHYDLDDAEAVATPAPPPDTDPDLVVNEEQLERVERELERHDAAQSGEPQRPPLRRGGGLADTVRGLMGRRPRR
jgi:hypothetical protein